MSDEHSIRRGQEEVAGDDTRMDIDEGAVQAEEEASSSGESMQSELDEEDLDLLDHTLGRRDGRGFRRLQRRTGSGDEREAASDGHVSESSDEAVVGSKRRVQNEDLERMFQDSDEEDRTPVAMHGGRPGESEDDDLDDFIEDDLGSGDQAAAGRPKATRAVPKSRSADFSRFGAGLSRDVLQDMLDIFGDGYEYADMVDDELASEPDGAQPEPDGRGGLQAKTSVLERDVPERYVASGLAPLAAGELERETPWVAQRLLATVQERRPEISMERLVPVVGSVLSLMRDQLLEVPFIATHRKEYFQHLLGLSDLWRILDLDEEWRALGRQRDAFSAFVARHGDALPVTGVEDAAGLELLQEYYKQVVRWGAGRGRLHVSRDQLLPAVRSFVLEPEQLLYNWATKESKHVPGEPSEEDVAWLSDAEALAAAELAYAPSTSRMFRTALEAVACVSVTPTATGQKEMGLAHELAPYKWLTERPVAVFTDDLWLRLKRAEAAGLLTPRIVFRRLPELEAEWATYYGATGGSLWAAKRLAVLTSAIHTHLLPRMQRLVLGRLQKQAESYVAQGCQYALQSRLMQGPHQVAQGGCISALSWGEGAPGDATMCVVLDGAGRVIEQARFVHLQDAHGRGTAEWDRLLALIEETQPVFLVVGGTSVRTVELYDRLRGRLREASLDERVRLVFGDDDAARLYPSTQQAQREFPEYGQLLRYCVSLGRRWLCPLFELAALPVSEAARLALHPAQALVPAEFLERFLARALINVTNLVGLDLPLLATGNAWARAPLRWVAGLGPASADALARRLASSKTARRSDLSALFPGPTVCANAASFLRISVDDAGQWPPAEPLDATRIHPENYPLARKIAGDATAIEGVGEDNEEETGRRAVLAAMKYPERLNDLLLEEYARELERRLSLPKHLTLLDIKAELQAPYADLRTVLEATPAETVFESLTGETEASLYLGQHVQARVTRLSDRAAICRLESGLTGILSVGHMAPAPDTGRAPSHPSRALRPGQAVVAAVMDIHLTRFEVTLSTRPEDMREPRRPRAGDYDPYYDHEAAKQLQKRRRGFSDGVDEQNAGGQKAEPPSQPSQAPRRLISHPSYKEVSRVEAERLLSSAVLGEVIVRPSASRGPDHLALTWKIDQCEQGGLYQHVDIHEADRPADNIYGLGRKLRVTLPDGAAHSYEDLDEIIARFVEPTAAFLQDVRACPKFRPVNTLDRSAARAHIESFLAAERQKAPGRIAYCLSLSRDKPGAVLLSYQSASRCHHETMDVSPSGYKLRGTTFERLEALINWFKQNHNRR